MTNMPEKSTVVYPESHPKGVEIRDLQTRMNDRYKEMRALDEQGRAAYKSAMTSLTEMAECRDKSYELLRENATDMVELQDLVVMPLL